MQTLVDFNEGAKRLSVSPFSLRAWARKNLVRTVRVGRRRLIPAEEIERIGREGIRTKRESENN